MIPLLNVPPRMLDLQQYYSYLLPIARQHTLPCINVDQPICRLPLSDPFRRWKHFGRCTSGSFWKSHPKFNVLVVIQLLLSPSSHSSPFPLIVQLQNQQSLTLPIWTAGRLFQDDGDGVSLCLAANRVAKQEDSTPESNTLPCLPITVIHKMI